jgi:hypothetical protein
MAMSKKERAEFDALLDELRLVAALRWTEPVAPDVPTPKGNELSRGYLPIGVMSDSARVTEACSSSVNHGLDHQKTSTQQPRALYSTRLLALKALRHQIEIDCAQRLARVDRQIEALRAVGLAACDP